MFLSSHEKQLDSKRRLLVPQDFRATAARGTDALDAFDGVYCFSAVEAECLECGGAAFFERYRALIERFPVGSPTRRALEHKVYGGMQRLNFDTAGRITLPESLCARFGLSDTVVMVGLYDRFQVWSPRAYESYAAEQEALARDVFAGGIA
ncbi:MAG: division/cell wall cluster transcriptional repressor MraZ [Asticcacaulis sp.]